MGERHFSNEFPDYQGTKLIDSDGKLTGDIAVKIKKASSELKAKLEAELAKGTIDWSDFTIYTGSTGYGLLYFNLHLIEPKDGTHLVKALFYIERAMKELKGKRVSFMCGDPGTLALAGVIYGKLGQAAKSKDCLTKLQWLHQHIIRDREMSDELLFGRVGYLYALLFVEKHLGENSIDKPVIHKIYERIIQSGKDLAWKERSKCPLLYAWHDKKYLGAAHGVAGIFYVLMMITDGFCLHYENELVKPSIDFLIATRFPSGNYPSSIGSSTGDKLVHWCHGAPGWIHLFIMAYKRFGDAKYLEEAKSCAEVIWSRGLLKKGYGLCHGIAGNAYGFLALYKQTKDEKYLYRACKFAEWCTDYGKHGCRTPDRPLSMFEGLAGTVNFLVDIQKPLSASMPAFEL